MRRYGLLFPGQGAQAVGMGRDLTAAYGAARKVFEAANQELDLELDRLCFEGPIEELSASAVAQPAILTVSVAALRALGQAGAAPPAAGAAGLSLGEYTALVATGAIEFRAAVRLVRARGIYMQEACDVNPGAMYSIIGLEDRAVEQVCRTAARETGGGVWPSNYNCPGQLVISGQEEPTARAAALCQEAGARRAIRLNVAGAFHTPLMQLAADKLARKLEKTPIQDPRCPVPANVTGRPAAGAHEIRELLVRQVTHPVRWTDCMRHLIGAGITEFYEVGPGRVLRGLLRRIDSACNCTSIGKAQDVAAWAEDH